MKPDLIVIGHLLKETIKFPNKVVGPLLGGVAAYFAVIASALGARTGIVSKIGTDMSKDLLAPLFEVAVDTRGLSIEGAESRISELEYNVDGRKFMSYLRKGRKITFENIPKDYLEANIVYIAPQEWEVSIDVIESIYQFNKNIAIELAGYGGAHCSNHSLKTEKTFIKKLLSYCKIAKLSIEDAYYLFGEDDAIRIAKMLVKWVSDICIVTRAERGAIVATADAIYEIPPLTQKAVDCTGAGDAFAAAFLVSYLKSPDVREAGLFASATASLLIEKRGGLIIERIPDRSAIAKRMTEWNSRYIQ